MRGCTNVLGRWRRSSEVTRADIARIVDEPGVGSTGRQVHDQVGEDVGILMLHEAGHLVLDAREMALEKRTGVLEP